MQANRGLAVLALAAILVACGGGGGDAGDGGGDGGGQAPPAPTLSTAKSFNEFVNNDLTKWFNAQSIQRFAEYDHDFPDFPETQKWKQTIHSANPVPLVLEGDFQFYVARNQGFTNQFPTVTGYGSTSKIPGADPRVLQYSSYDNTTKQAAFGVSKIYYGIKKPSATSIDEVPILLIIEGVVSLQGVPQYRAIQVFDGVLTTTYTGLGYDINNSYLVGLWFNYAVEAYNGGLTGMLGNPFRACFQFSRLNTFNLWKCD